MRTNVIGYGVSGNQKKGHFIRFKFSLMQIYLICKIHELINSDQIILHKNISIV